MGCTTSNSDYIAGYKEINRWNTKNIRKGVECNEKKENHLCIINQPLPHEEKMLALVAPHRREGVHPLPDT